ncbi:MAG: ABC transporter substrate-binding protein [Chloroflexi bacterium]|nr:ABC transporter substrate-binding protein [Chloroflexota bacterium]
MSVGYAQPLASDMPVWIAADSGIDARNGLTVDLQLTTSTTAMAAMLSGQVQMAVTGAAESLNATASGSDMVILANFTPVSTFRFEVPASIQKPEDLRGQKVGIGRFGSATDTAARAAIKKLGLDPEKDVSYVQLDTSANISAGLLSGSIQGAVQSVQEFSKTEKQGVHPLLDLATSGFPAADNVLTASRSWVNGHKDVVQPFMDSIVQASVREKNDKQFAEDVMRKYMKLDDQAVLDATYDYYRGILQVVPYTRAEQFVDIVPVLAANNSKLAGFDVNTVLDNSYLTNAESRGLAKES